jgi:hypothetical protein
MRTQRFTPDDPASKAAAATAADSDRLSAGFSLVVILSLSLTGWAVIGGMAYWALR